MRKYIFPISLCFLLLLSSIWLALPQLSSARGPDVLRYGDTGDEPTVLFSHDSHMASGLNCGDCHYSIFQKRKGDADTDGEMTMKALDEGKYCGKCHNGDHVFSTKENCGRCHIK